MIKNYSEFKTLLKDKKMEPLVDVAIFIFLTLIIHFAYRAWAAANYLPVGNFIASMHDFLAQRVFIESSWFIQNVLGMEITTANRTMYWANEGYIAINYGCSGLKQMIQFALLMAIFPGPWRHKLWYIPLGVFIVHLTNLFRIIGLAVVLVSVPDYWQFSHDYLFRPFFYVVIFSLWVYWVEKLKKK